MTSPRPADTPTVYKCVRCQWQGSVPDVISETWRCPKCQTFYVTGKPAEPPSDERETLIKGKTGEYWYHRSRSAQESALELLKTAQVQEKTIQRLTRERNELHVFAKALLDDDDITPGTLAFWAAEYKHAYERLCAADGVENKLRAAETELVERTRELDEARQTRYVSARGIEAEMLTLRNAAVAATERAEQAERERDEARAERDDAVVCWKVASGNHEPTKLWSQLLDLEDVPVATHTREAAFLRVYARYVRNEHPWDVPATMASALENVASHIEQRHEATEKTVIHLRTALEQTIAAIRFALDENNDWCDVRAELRVVLTSPSDFDICGRCGAWRSAHKAGLQDPKTAHDFTEQTKE